MNTRLVIFAFLFCLTIVSADSHKGFKEQKKLWKQQLVEEVKVDKADNHTGRHKYGHFRGDLVADGIEHVTGINKHHGAIDAWLHGIIHSTVMIIATEFCDKTFFITAILAMTQNKWAIWGGSLAALWLMTALSCFLGLILPALIPRHITIHIASLLFIVFGVKMIYEAKQMDDGNAEYDDAKNELNRKNTNGHISDSEHAPLVATPSSISEIKEETEEDNKTSKSKSMGFKSVFIEVFVMIFFAEWGDRSQVSCILLASTNPIVSVLIGGCIGHLICTTIATLSGQLLAKKVSPRLITFLGGILFLIFSITVYTMN